MENLNVNGRPVLDDYQANNMEESMNVPQNNDGQMQFSDEEIQNLREIFDLFDKDKTGSINTTDLEAIMQSLQRDAQEAKDLLTQIRQQNDGDSQPEN